MKKEFCIFFCWFLCVSFAQESNSILENNLSDKENFITYFNQSYVDLAKNILPNYQGEVKRQLKESLEDYRKNFIQEIEENRFTFDSRFLDLANDILDELKQKNRLIPEDLKIIISKQTVLNAYCLPNGTLVLNMGLFYWLENEDQLAAIIAHEVAHKVLEHGIKSQVKYIEDNYSDKNRKIVKNIARDPTKKSEKAFKLFKSQLYSNAKTRQQYEYEADSLSFEFIKNSKFDGSQITSSMRLSIRYDTINPIGLENKIYKELFDLPMLPFKEKWLQMEDFSQYNYDLYKEKINKDSVFSHPEMVLRIKKLENEHPSLAGSTFKPASFGFKKLEKLAEINIVPNLIDLENYGYAIYICLLNIQKGNEIDNYKVRLGKGFNLVYQARKNYNLNRYLDRIDPKNHSESYQQFLNFMWNLKLDEYKIIAEYFSTNSKQ